MADLARTLQKIFGETGGATEFGKIGSDALGVPATSKDLDEIQSLAPFAGGLFDITSNAAEPPRIEDINALYFLITSQLAYLMQKGIPEWLATETYYADKSFTTKAGAIYRSVLESTGVDPATDDGTNWALVTDPNKTEEIRLAIEYGHHVGEVFSLEDLKLPAGFTRATPSTYFPAICLTNLATHADLDVAQWPKLVPNLLLKKMIFKDGVTGEIANPGVINWAIDANVATLTFTNDADHIAFLSALLEDEVAHGGYTNWRSVTLASAIGNITAGTYAITNVNASSRTISFAFTAGNASGAVTTTCEFFAHKIPGSTTTARVFSARGLTMHGANDDNGYFVAGGLRRRGFMQGHSHRIYYSSGTNSGSTGTGAGGLVTTSGALGRSAAATDILGTNANRSVTLPEDDGTNGVTRQRKETHGPAMTVHLYLHGGEYIAP